MALCLKINRDFAYSASVAQAKYEAVHRSLSYRVIWRYAPGQPICRFAS